MTDTNWLKQSRGKALFEDLLWSRPETKSRAGKLLIVGGNAHGFKAPATAYSLALKAGAGSLRVLLPNSLKPSVGKYIEDAVYCPSNKSGSLSRQSLAELLDQAAWADATLLAGDFGHNSETSVLLESFIDDYKGLLCLTGDSLMPFLTNPISLFDRPNTLLVSSLGMLQKLFANNHESKAITSSLGLIQMVELLNEITKKYQAAIITNHLDNYLVSIKGQTATTAYGKQINDWESLLASYCSVYWLQNSSRVFEALTTAIFEATVN